MRARAAVARRAAAVLQARMGRSTETTMPTGLSIMRRVAAGLLAVAASLLPAGAFAAPADTDPPPVVFVHGNGDTAAEWMVTLWRWESNGYPSDRLFAVDLHYPTANFLADEPQPGRSTTDASAAQLARFVDRVLDSTGADKVDLVGNSRGASAIRNFVKNRGGAAVTAHVVLGGGVNHGAFDIPGLFPTSEFNDASPFIQQLNSGPTETVAGVKFLTIRSDMFDKYAQPDGRFIVGFPGIPTGIGYDAPALRGARNIVLPGVDHRETSMSEDGFEATFAFITGSEPERARIVRQSRPRLRGRITGITAGVYDNMPVDGAELAVYQVNRRSGERRGAPVYRTVTGKDGVWGPFEASPDANYEFVLKVPNQPVTHIYRSPFLRSSAIVHLRPGFAVADPQAGSVVVLNRMSGYFGVEDRVQFDGKRPKLSTDAVPNEVETTVRTPFVQASHTARFDEEVIALRNWPQGEVSIVQFSD